MKLINLNNLKLPELTSGSEIDRTIAKRLRDNMLANLQIAATKAKNDSEYEEAIMQFTKIESALTIKDLFTLNTKELIKSLNNLNISISQAIDDELVSVTILGCDRPLGTHMIDGVKVTTCSDEKTLEIPHPK
jgi:nitrogenase molybdenum-iron protein alpha/beta subunit